MIACISVEDLLFQIGYFWDTIVGLGELDYEAQSVSSKSTFCIIPVASKATTRKLIMSRSRKIATIVATLTRFKDDSFFQKVYTVAKTMWSHAYSQLPTVVIDTTTEETIKRIEVATHDAYESLKTLTTILLSTIYQPFSAVLFPRQLKLANVLSYVKEIFILMLTPPVALLFYAFFVGMTIFICGAKITLSLGAYALSWLTRKNIKIALGVLVYAFKIGLRDKFFKRVAYLKKISIVLKSLQYSKLFNEPKNKNRSWVTFAGEAIIAIARFFVDLYINTSIEQKIFILGSLTAFTLPSHPLVIPAIFMWAEFMEYKISSYCFSNSGAYPERDFFETVMVMHYCRECIDYLRGFPILNEVAEGSYATYLLFGYVFYYANIAIKEALVVAAAQCELLLGALANIPVLNALVDVLDSLVRVVAPWIFGCNFQHIYIPPTEAEKLSKPHDHTNNYEPKPSSLESWIHQCSTYVFGR